MEWTEAKNGRVFVLRLEDGDILHEVVERFAGEKGIAAATVVAVGGVDKGSALVVGPEDGRAAEIKPMRMELPDIAEAAGCGTIFADDDGNPILHMHMACGRKDKTVTGCVRAGVKTWLVLEVVISEIVGADALRKTDPKSGFKLLAVGGGNGQD